MLTPKEISNLVDLTSLNAFDSPESIDDFLKQTHEYNREGFKVAAVCLYPNFARQAAESLKGSGIKTAVVAGSFPSSQSFLSTRLNECEMALEAGAEEIDIVLNLGAFDQGDYDQVTDEIRAFKGLMPQNDLKVILETGYLSSEKRIAKAAELALKGGADFIKTSTGKEFPGAELNAAKIMAQMIQEHEKLMGRKAGLKISGGIRTQEQAIDFINVVKDVLGDSYINPSHFRIGASSLLKNLIKG